MVTVHLERLKLFMYQSQQKGPFPIPHCEPSSLEPVGLPSWDRDSRLPGPHSPFYRLQKTQGKRFISSLLDIALANLKRLILWSFITFFPLWGIQINRGLGTYWQRPTSLQSQETWPLPSSLRNTQCSRFIFTQFKFGTHPFNQACQYYVFIWPMMSPHS